MFKIVRGETIQLRGGFIKKRNEFQIKKQDKNKHKHPTTSNLHKFLIR